MSPAKYCRTQFKHKFTYNRKWQGQTYAHKTVEAYVVDEGTKGWFVITVIVKFF